MRKITSYADLAKAYAAYSPLLALRTGGARPASGKREFLVCGDTGCRSIRSLDILKKLRRAIAKAGLKDTAEAHITGCFGFCKKGPIVKVFPEDVFYVDVTANDAEEIVTSHMLHGAVVERLLYRDPEKPEEAVTHEADIGFYKKQMRTALANCGLINPEKIEEYIAAQGYQALASCLQSMQPADVVRCITDSGLRGRGGGGFPTGRKWAAAAAQPEGKKYVVCNADEGDPGAFMDRSILEGDPHCVLEGMAIAAYAIGADQGYIYIRAEYPLAVERLGKALAQARKVGLLGKNIMGSGFSFDLELKLGAGAFVCGEETALLRSIEGGRGEPTPKPPFPAEKGLYGKPTIINNVETLANVRRIILGGADWYSAIGSEKSKGTKVFALAGKVNNVGLVEVPMGITLREIIHEIGGGIRDGKRFKAVQTGGPSGGCISTENLDIPIDYESLTGIGSMMGSGGMIVMDEDNCMVDIAKYYLSFIMEESCGKCTPCRVGNKRMHEMLTDITEGKGTEEHLEKLQSLGKVIQDTALCGLGQTAPNPVLSTMRYFWDEYVTHVKDKHCPAKVCPELLDYFITEACIGCERCARDCPVNCIEGSLRERHVIDTKECIKCGTCITCCPVNAVVRQ
ncbi:putative (Fe) hydrogenase, electron-transfer subunit [uncultured delta proteobacterium]|uniref:Putative (Fe) hydrogenase, electron-transfer subunit n=1 Tax=uncultured delta proteobacterium TaxID=34034 RepID=A0A212JAZ7_9DELT|nr:putative (Fe) hydrogenase, electron-transfer subunit [uncultured delta proteobacterium]